MKVPVVGASPTCPLKSLPQQLIDPSYLIAHAASVSTETDVKVLAAGAPLISCWLSPPQQLIEPVELIAHAASLPKEMDVNVPVVGALLTCMLTSSPQQDSMPPAIVAGRQRVVKTGKALLTTIATMLHGEICKQSTI